MSHHHRPTLKQQNKPFKSKHATKSSLKEAAKGRIARTNVKSVGLSTSTQTRLNRRNAAKQAQQKKRGNLASATKIFNGPDGAPRIVAVIPLCPDVSAYDAVRAIATPLDVDISQIPNFGTWGIRAERFKSNVQFTLLPYRQLYAALDACKVADYVVFVLSAETEVDAWGDMALRCLQSQGLPEVVTTLMPTPAQDIKSRAGILKSLLSFIQYFVPTQQKVLDLSNPSDAVNTIRSLCEGRPAAPRWRDGRAWGLADTVEWESTSPLVDPLTQEGTLKFFGVIRGSPLSAERLVHIPSFGDFQVEKIVSCPSTSRARRDDLAMEVEPQVLSERTNDGDSLTSRLDPDTMQNEQTWPTEEEMAGADGSSSHPHFPPAKAGTTPKAVRKVPKGTSAYQAAWIVDDDEEEEGEGDDDGASGSDGEAEMEEDGEEEQKYAPEEIEMVDEEEETDTRKSTVAFADLDMEEEGKQLDDWRASRMREDKDDLEFPDELDTPKDISARIRFQRYRGLRSFRTSPWDPYENLPVDYSRIFQFEDYERTKRKVRRQAEEDGVAPGARVCIHIKNVPKAVIEAYNPAYPFVLFGLLQHEHKHSVTNFVVQRNTEYDGSVRSKDPLILCVGPRRFATNPVYSQHLRGGGKGANNVHKFERYLRHGVASVATTYGPIVFGKQPCLLLRETEDPQAPALVATGTFMNPDPKRVVAKRIVLTGHPFKVNKKTATIRYMFFNPEDIAYFAPIQLHTKLGRTGHITESLGTHGYYKAHFDGPISQMDTICMSLYKRVFPKWSEVWVEKGRIPVQKVVLPAEDKMEMEE